MSESLSTNTWNTTSAIGVRARSTTWSPACGITSPTMRSRAMRRLGCISIQPSFTCSVTKAKYYSVRGPLNVARPVQGWPVIVQAGASEPGRQLAAETAEVVFAAASQLADGKRFYADVKGRMDKLGRDRDHLKILPGAFVVVGETVAEARDKRAKLDSLVHFDSSIASLSIALGYDISHCDPEGPLPEIPPSNASQTSRDRVVDLARRENLNVRQLAQRLGGFSGLAFVGTPRTIADEMEAWLVEEGSDGFNVMFPYSPRGSTTSSTKSSRSCNGAASSGASTRARRCAKISVCRGRRIDTFSARESPTAVAVRRRS